MTLITFVVSWHHRKDIYHEARRGAPVDRNGPSGSTGVCQYAAVLITIAVAQMPGTIGTTRPAVGSQQGWPIPTSDQRDHGLSPELMPWVVPRFVA